MTNAHVAMMRLLRSFMEKSGLPWNQVHLTFEADEDGRPQRTNRRIEMWFPYNNQKVDVYLVLPTESTSDPEQFPNGKLAGRMNDKVVKGPLDEATWNDIVKMIKEGD